MKNNRKLEELIKRLSKECEIWLNYTKTFNFNTVSDRLLKKILATANEIITLYQLN